MKTLFAGLIAAGFLTAFDADASIIQYSFTATGGHSGSFSFDDTNTTTVSRPFGFLAGGDAWYSAISFNVDGAPVAPAVVGIYDNVPGVGDCVEVSGTGGTNGPVVTLCGPDNLWSGNALSVADNLQLSSFTSRNFLSFPVSNFSLSTLTQGSAVPEPATLALIGLGLSGLALTRRRKSH